MTEITQADRDAAEAYREKVLSAIWEGKSEEPVLAITMAERWTAQKNALRLSRGVGMLTWTGAAAQKPSKQGSI
jgi:hypothetical protein